ncbi:hypothetical protein BJX62DRAFT_243550 [Aspergillus germanicus]
MAPPFGHQEADLWTPEEVERLFQLRTTHAELSWAEFHARNFFPGRTQMSLSVRWHRMAQTRDLPVIGRRLNATVAGKRDTRNEGSIEADDEKSARSKGTEVAVHNDNRGAQRRKRRRSMWSIESSSDSEAGDIDHDGHTRRLRSCSSRRRTTTPQASLPDKGAGESSQPPDRVRPSQQNTSRPSRRTSKFIGPKPTTRSSTPRSESGVVSDGEMENFERYPYKTRPEIRAHRARARQGDTTSEKRTLPLQTPQSASSTSSHPTVSAEPESYAHNHEPFAGRPNAPHIAQRSTNCKARKPSVPEPNPPSIGPRQLLGGEQVDTEISPNADVDLMVLVPMPQLAPLPAPLQRTTSATPVESTAQAEEPGTTSTRSERIKTPDRPPLPGTTANSGNGLKDSPSTTVQESQDTVAETIRSSTAPSANTTPKPETPAAGVNNSPSLSEHLSISMLSMPQPQIFRRHLSKPGEMTTSVPSNTTLTPNYVDQFYHTGIEAIRSGARNLESYYSAINDQQITENKLLKEANQGLQSLMRPLFAENAALKQEVAEKTEELVGLRKEQKRCEENLQHIGRIVSTCRTVEELAGLLLTPSERS